MFEQELASIAKFVIEASGNPQPYYNNIPQNFQYPSVYFPMPEISAKGDTLKTYAADYAWYIKFFAQSREEAYKLAFRAFTQISRKRCLIPIYNQDGSKAGKGIRIALPSVKVIDEGVAQLEITFRSYRPYEEIDGEKMMIWTATITSCGAVRVITNRGEAD